MTESFSNDRIMSECPRFDACSIPICPLDNFKEQRVRLSEDSSCTMEKRVRLRIGIKNGLANYGLTKAEISGILKHYKSINSYVANKYPSLLDFSKKLPMLQKQNVSKGAGQGVKP